MRPIWTRLPGLRHGPGVAATFVLTLGLGIGATTAVFSSVAGVLLRPLPYPHADRIVYVEQPATRAGVDNARFSFIEIDDYRQQSALVDEIVEYGDWQFSIVGQGEPMLEYGGLVTSNYFDVLSIQPYLGRTLVSADDDHGAPPVAVLTYEFWQRGFGADKGVIGRVIELTGIPTTIVGVLEPGAHYAGSERAALYANYSTNAHYMGAAMQKERSHRMTDVYARMAPGVELAATRAEFETIAARLHGTYPADYSDERGYELRLTPWRDVLIEEARPTLLILMGGVALLLVVVTANVGNLSLLMFVRRERELSVRAALGASPKRLRAVIVGEHVVLAFGAAAVGIVVAYLGLGLLVDYASRLTLRAEEIRIDTDVLAFSLALGVVLGTALAFVPRLPAASRALAAGADGGRGTVGGSQHRLRKLLVAAQVAVSFVVLFGAGLLWRSKANVEQIDLGFETTALATLRAPNFTRTSAERSRAIFDDVATRLAAYPGVESVATASLAPFDPRSVFAWYVRVDGDAGSGDESFAMLQQVISPEYFDTLGVRLAAGRPFGIEDTTDGAPVVIVNAALAARVFGSDDPIDRRVQWSFEGRNWTEWARVIGVAPDLRDGTLQDEALPTIYQPDTQATPGPAVIVRTAGDPSAALQEAARLIHGQDSKRPIVGARTLDSALAELVAPSRLMAGLFGAFAALALCLASVGLVGVLAFAVSERRREFGIRLALGSSSGRILLGVIREGAVLAALGTVAGAICSVAFGGAVEGALFGVAPADVPTLTGSATCVLAVAVAASWWPARTATRVDPARSLRG